MKTITQDEARKQDFIIDTCCNPPVAYKGPRFQPTEHCYCFTDREVELMTALEIAHDALTIQNKVIEALRDPEAKEDYKSALVEKVINEYPAAEQVVFVTLRNLKALAT